MVAGAAVLAVAVITTAVITTVVVTRPAGDTTTVVVASPTETTPMTLVHCQFLIATRTKRYEPVTCGYQADGTRSPFSEPEADLSDPRFFGAALPDALTTEGIACVFTTQASAFTTRAPTTVDKVYPTLSASFVQVTGLRRVEPTFQLTGAGRDNPLALERAGPSVGPGQRADLGFRMIQPLKEGETYRWRVRSTPQDIAGGDWSPWCEFTVAQETSDHLGLDDGRDYTVTLSAAEWRTVLKALAAAESSARDPIAAAVDRTSKSDKAVPVTLSGRNWSLVVSRLARQASVDEAPKYWRMADAVSSALGQHPHPTMGFPRPEQAA
jgi:hypothetical protein